MIRTTVLAAAFALLSGAAQAGTLEMTRPVQAVTLHDGAVDMVAYYLDRDDHYEVVVTYAAQAESASLRRLRVGLADGDSTRFSLPGHREIVYSFTREGRAVHLRADLTRTPRS